MQLKNIFALLFCVVTCNAFCQSYPLPRNMQTAYANDTRSANGLPGERYWQNRANYNISISFNPASRLLQGTVGIDYYNNSPDTLTSLLFKLYPNLYKTDAIRNMPVALKDLQQDGVRIKSMSVEGIAIDSTKRIIKGTNMAVKGARILPHQKAHVDIAYSYIVNQGSFIRTGQVDTGAFVIAYFFPRIAVYDDIDGWNEYPYAGREEFYNDYGSFDVQIAAPGDYVVWATGELTNTNDVFQPACAKRIAQAEKSDTVVSIIDEGDLAAGHITTRNAVNTWHFHAEEVPDFAITASNHYVWNASGVTVDKVTGRRTRVDAVFNPMHTAYLPVAGYSRKVVSLISDTFPGISFPYPHITIFDGLDAMEYPMMVNNLPFKEPKEVIEFTAHEVFHSIFPFYVGTNETKHSFLDEGWATLSEFLLHPLIDADVPLQYDISPVNESVGTEEDMPLLTPTAQLYGKARYADKDLKPALALLYLKEMLGEKKFWQATRTFINQWKGKHPTPFDFFNCFNTATNINLNWFWQNWYVQKNVPDLAISHVRHEGQNYIVEIERPGTQFVPVHLRIVYRDGTTNTVTKDISCWQNGNNKTVLQFKTARPVKELILGNDFDVDIQPANNRWTSK